jgi:hypothetical protein
VLIQVLLASLENGIDGLVEGALEVVSSVGAGIWLYLLHGRMAMLLFGRNSSPAMMVSNQLMFSGVGSKACCGLTLHALRHVMT